MSFNLPLFVAILAGVLAAACPGVLERVEINRLRMGGELAGPGVVKLGVEDCSLLGKRGVVIVDGLGTRPAYVVDCQQRAHRLAQPMSGRGIVADVNEAGLNHKRAVVVLR